MCRTLPAESRRCVLEPGGSTAFRSDSNSNTLTHPARGQAHHHFGKGSGGDMDYVVLSLQLMAGVAGLCAHNYRDGM